MIEVVDSQLHRALFMKGLLAWPKDGSDKLKEQFIAYHSPPNKLDKAKKIADFLLAHQTNNPRAVGLAGSLARGTATEASDIDFIAFLTNEEARRFSYQNPADIWDDAPIKTVFEVMNIEKKQIENIVKEGLPDGSGEGLILPPIDYRFLILPYTADRDCIEMNIRINGPDYLSSLARDLLLYKFEQRSFVRPESHWLFDLTH